MVWWPREIVFECPAFATSSRGKPRLYPKHHSVSFSAEPPWFEWNHVESLLIGGLEPWNFMTFHSVGNVIIPTDSYFSEGSASKICRKSNPTRIVGHWTSSIFLGIENQQILRAFFVQRAILDQSVQTRVNIDSKHQRYLRYLFMDT